MINIIYLHKDQAQTKIMFFWLARFPISFIFSRHFDFVYNISSILVLLCTDLDPKLSPGASLKWFIALGWNIQVPPGMAEGTIFKCSTPLNFEGKSLRGKIMRFKLLMNRNALC